MYDYIYEKLKDIFLMEIVTANNKEREKKNGTEQRNLIARIKSGGYFYKSTI